MNLPANFTFRRLYCLQKTGYFFREHFMVIMGLGLIAAFGRVIQLEGFGPISLWLNIVLEIAIEAARVLLVVYVLGLTDIKNGLLSIRRFFLQKHNRKAKWAAAVENIRRHWLAVLLNLTGFAIIAWGINYLIDLLAYQTCLYLSLKESGILAENSSEWTILLFFKNLSVIPFTLVFETLLIRWLTSKLTYTGMFAVVK